MSATWTLQRRHIAPTIPLLSKAPAPSLCTTTSIPKPLKLSHPLPTPSWSYFCTTLRKYRCQVSVACAVSKEGGKLGSSTARCAGTLGIRLNSTGPHYRPTAAEPPLCWHEEAVSVGGSEVIPVSLVTQTTIQSLAQEVGILIFLLHCHYKVYRQGSLIRYEKIKTIWYTISHSAKF